MKPSLRACLLSLVFCLLSLMAIFPKLDGFNGPRLSPTLSRSPGVGSAIGRIPISRTRIYGQPGRITNNMRHPQSILSAEAVAAIPNRYTTLILSSIIGLNPSISFSLICWLKHSKGRQPTRGSMLGASTQQRLSTNL